MTTTRLDELMHKARATVLDHAERAELQALLVNRPTTPQPAPIEPTGGPWYFQQVGSPGFCHVRDTWGRPITLHGPTGQANARLMAAAPELRDALRLAFEFLDRNFDDADMADILGPCREALRRAGALPSTTTRAREADQWTEDELASLAAIGCQPATLNRIRAAQAGLLPIDKARIDKAFADLDAAAFAGLDVPTVRGLRDHAAAHAIEPDANGDILFPVPGFRNLQAVVNDQLAAIDAGDVCREHGNPMPCADCVFAAAHDAGYDEYLAGKGKP